MLSAVKNVSCFVYQKTLNSNELAIRTISNVILYEVTKKTLRKVFQVGFCLFQKFKNEYNHTYNLILEKEKFVCVECLSKKQKDIVEEMKNVVPDQKKLDAVTPNGDPMISDEQILRMINKN